MLPVTLAVLLLLPSAAALAGPAARSASCAWNQPGHDPYRGTLAAAVDRYEDIPAPVRARLKERMVAFRYDEIAAIRRDSITGSARYAPEIRDMHFGAGRVCAQVDRSRWSDAMVERGLVYCESGHCLIVPTVCRNVSRVTRLAPAVAALPALPGAAAPAAATAGDHAAEAAPDGAAWRAGAPGPSFDALRGADPAAAVSADPAGPALPALALDLPRAGAAAPGHGGPGATWPVAGGGAGSPGVAWLGGRPPAASAIGVADAELAAPPAAWAVRDGVVLPGGFVPVPSLPPTVVAAAAAVAVVPEPGTLWLGLLGLLGVAGRARRRRRAAASA